MSNSRQNPGTEYNRSGTLEMTITLTLHLVMDYVKASLSLGTI